ncbi:hypothetical protein ES677_03025 [Bizionia gelidisalsuginis]|uniref:Auto-transporter adhesin head GIN domain-containing protein n=2 Tax=Bizionia TaxID=283785 RepID=A0A8H2LHN7_9FLAO|nr:MULTISPECIES: hypothetical protein [Bizionia]TYB80323.1 hypothetical protein ES676_01245 [Bizionia saleffrena]TYC17166.1 hypothetical protein ES677_03025 [Bizionia gelidisalsuginis]
MKTTINLKVVFASVLFMTVFQISFCQNYNKENTESETTVTKLNGENVSPEIFSSFFTTTVNPKLSIVQGNSVFVTQIGAYNTIAADVTSNASEIRIAQNGDLNKVQLDYEVNKVVADLKQIGNNNNIKDYVLDRNAEISLDLIQNGDNLKFERFGSNEITKNIKFTQTDASPTIIIRSFE